jgi:hypothetical protein
MRSSPRPPRARHPGPGQLLPGLVAAALLATPGCPRTPPAGGPPPTPDEMPALAAEVAAIEARTEALLHAQAELTWRSWVEGAPVDLAGTYAGSEAFLSPAALRSVARTALGTEDPERRAALRLLESHLLAEQLAAAVASLDERIGEIEASATITVDGHTVPYRDAGRLLAHEPDWHRRRAIHRATVPVLEALAPLLEEKEAHLRRTVADLGYGTVLDVAVRLRRTEIGELRRLAREVLDRTEAAYAGALAAIVADELDLPLERFGWPDVPLLFQLRDLDGHFPADALVDHLNRTLEGLGLSADAGGRIHIDDGDGPRKNPRPICIPVAVPTDVRLSIKPAGGLADYQALFHEMGHAQHYAAVATEHFAFRHLGDSTSSEAFAFLFEGLLADPIWLAERTDLPEAARARLVRVQAFQRLYMARRYAAKVLFELALHGGELTGEVTPAEAYAAHLSEAYGFALGPEDAARWQVDQDDFLYAADYLRAWVLEAQIADFLVGRFGERWWQQAEAGTWLTAQWAAGNRPTPSEAARAAGARRLDVRPFVKRTTLRLSAQAPEEAPAEG